MAIEIEITGNGRFAGHRSNIVSYSVTEESTPIDASDSSGGTGTISFGVTEDPAANGTILLMNDTISLEDGVNGTTAGLIDGVGATDGNGMISASSRLAMLNTDVTMPPHVGTLGSLFLLCLAKVGITSGIVVDPTLSVRPCITQGFEGNLWVFVKQLCAVYQCEVSLVSSNVVLRPLRTRIAELGTVKSSGYNVTNGELAQNVEVAYYNNTEINNGLVFPKGGWKEDTPLIDGVDAGRTVVVEIPINVSLTSVVQPTCVDYVARGYTGPSSLYSVSGSDGLPIKAAEWIAGGGQLTVAISADTKSLIVTVVAPQDPAYAPYQIAVTAGPSDYYSSLRVIGTGVGFDRQTIVVPTGAPPSKAPQVMAPTIDNPTISSLGAAQAAAARAADRFSTPNHTVTISATVINRAGDGGSTIYPTFGDFDDSHALAMTFAQFDALWAGKTFADFDAAQLALVRDEFENQAFGNIGGARLRFREAQFRIRSGTVNQNGIINATAEEDTIFSDFDAEWAGLTFAAFDARFAGLTFEEFAVIPLWT